MNESIVPVSNKEEALVAIDGYLSGFSAALVIAETTARNGGHQDLADQYANLRSRPMMEAMLKAMNQALQERWPDLEAKPALVERMKNREN